VAREAFIFYRSFFESINELPEKNQMQLYKALIEFGLNGTEPDLKGVNKSIFTLIRPQLEANNKRYEDGKKGGRPKEKKPVVIKNDNQWLDEKITITEPKEKENDKENVNDNDKENDKELEVSKKENKELIIKESARESYDEIFKNMEVSDYLKAAFIEFIKHCQINGKILTNSKLLDLIFKFDKLYGNEDKPKADSLRSAINGGYFDIKENH